MSVTPWARAASNSEMIVHFLKRMRELRSNG